MTKHSYSSEVASNFAACGRLLMKDCQPESFSLWESRALRPGEGQSGSHRFDVYQTQENPPRADSPTLPLRGRVIQVRSPAKSRRGLSLMEVLFAIGVLTVGILGIASVLPVATSNASKTLQRDKGIEEVSNRIASDIARIGDQLDSIILANNSRSAFDNAGPSFHLRFLERELDSTQDAICIDPWFLTAADNLRPDNNPMPDTTRNGYDRTQFPCYDARFNPLLSPSEQISASGPWPNTRDIWLTPRFTRVAIPRSGTTAAPSFQAMQSGAREADNLSLFQPKDTTLPPGLFVQKASQSRSLTKTSVSGRYSSMVMMSRSAPGSNVFQTAIVTMLDREVVIVRGGGPLAFQLAPYTAAAPDAINPADDELTYADEVMGYVTFAPRPFIGGGGGEFVYKHSSAMSPKIRSGDWLMLARQEYGVGGTALEVKYAWYQVRSVVQKPTLQDGGTTFETRVSVRGPDWVFHPRQVLVQGLGYGPPYTATNPPTAANPPTYDITTTPADRRFGTIVVLMPKVVSVYQTTTRL